MIRARPLPILLLLAASSAGLCACADIQKCGLSCPGDRQITAEVEALFDQHPALEAPNELHIHTLNSVVYLTGIVNSPREQQLATLVAREAPGAADVINSIGLYSGR